MATSWQERQLRLREREILRYGARGYGNRLGNDEITNAARRRAGYTVTTADVANPAVVADNVGTENMPDTLVPGQILSVRQQAPGGVYNPAGAAEAAQGSLGGRPEETRKPGKTIGQLALQGIGTAFRTAVENYPNPFYQGAKGLYRAVQSVPSQEEFRRAQGWEDAYKQAAAAAAGDLGRFVKKIPGMEPGEFYQALPGFKQEFLQNFPRTGGAYTPANRMPEQIGTEQVGQQTVSGTVTGGRGTTNPLNVYKREFSRYQEIYDQFKSLGIDLQTALNNGMISQTDAATMVHFGYFTPGGTTTSTGSGGYGKSYGRGGGGGGGSSGGGNRSYFAGNSGYTGLVNWRL